MPENLEFLNFLLYIFGILINFRPDSTPNYHIYIVESGLQFIRIWFLSSLNRKYLKPAEICYI